jgi:hypothetical protein
MAFKKKDKDTDTTDTEVQQEASPQEEKETVSRAPRASRSESRKKFDRDSFRRPNDLSFPEEMKDYFEKEGYFLRWVAVVDAKTKAFSNSRINFYMSLGGDLVTAQDIKNTDPTFLSGMTKYSYQEEWADIEDDRNSQEGIRKEHLVLMKIPVEYRDYRQEENRSLVSDQLSTAQQEYKKNDDAFVKDFKHGSSHLKVKEGFFKD